MGWHLQFCCLGHHLYHITIERTALPTLLGARFFISMPCFSRPIQKEIRKTSWERRVECGMSVTPVVRRLREEDPHEFKASLSYTDPVSKRQSFTDTALTHTTKQVPCLQIEMKGEPCLWEIIVLLCFLCVCTFLCVRMCWGCIPMYMYESACGGRRSTVVCSFLAFHLIL